jgi:single-stranded DNA-binding protein
VNLRLELDAALKRIAELEAELREDAKKKAPFPFSGDDRIYRRIATSGVGDMNNFQVSGFVWDPPILAEAMEGGNYCRVTLANRVMKHPRPGKRYPVQYTNWMRPLCWGAMARAVCKQIEYGDYCLFEGQVRYSQWRQGDRWRYTLDLLVDKFKRVTRKADRQPVEVDVDGHAYRDTLWNSDLVGGLEAMDEGFGEETDG